MTPAGIVHSEKLLQQLLHLIGLHLRMRRAAREHYVQSDLVGAREDLRTKTTRGLVKPSGKGASYFQTESKLFLSDEARRKTVRDEGRESKNNRFAV